jgi:hypothetical protein
MKCLSLSEKWAKIHFQLFTYMINACNQYYSWFIWRTLDEIEGPKLEERANYISHAVWDVRIKAHMWRVNKNTKKHREYYLE